MYCFIDINWKPLVCFDSDRENYKRTGKHLDWIDEKGNTQLLHPNPANKYPSILQHGIPAYYPYREAIGILHMYQDVSKSQPCNILVALDMP